MAKVLPAKKRSWNEMIFLAVLVVVFVSVVGTYFYAPLRKLNRARTAWAASASAQKLLALPTVCPEGKIAIHLSEGLLCRNEVPASLWRDIYDTYPLDPKGREHIYDFLGSEDIEVADAYLKDLQYVPRFDPVMVSPITWEEDPYGEKYWRFIYYGLRSPQDLLYAWEQTGDARYKDKYIEIIDSFLEVGMEKSNAWDDEHAVAFRTMMIIDAWWRLREHGALPVELSEKILKALQRHGDFLIERNHYQAEYNHGINEAAATFLLAAAFPDLPGAEDWKRISIQRLTNGLLDIVDADGVLVENSPYYHFNSLEKYWSIITYADAQGMPFPSHVVEKIRQMIDYGSYIVQPDLQVPLLGASLQRTMHATGVEKQIADQYPAFKFVMTSGAEGSRPDRVSRYFPDAGQAILRSGWGTNVRQADPADF
jgi:hypothetical protein